MIQPQVATRDNDDRSCRNEAVEKRSKIETDMQVSRTVDVSESGATVSTISPSVSRILLLASCLASGNMVWSILTNSMIVMLDNLSDSLHVTENNLQWILNSLQLPFGCFILTAGRVADIYGRRAVFLTGQTMMIISASLTGFMRHESAFYVFRAVTGLGGALVTASNFGLLAEITTPGKLRSISLGILFAGQTAGGALGFAISGPLVEATGWRSIFYLVAGLWVLPLVGVSFLGKKPDPSGDRVVDKRIDFVGAFLFTAGFILVFLSLSQSVSENKGWTTPYVIAMLITGVVLLVAAVTWSHHLENRTSYPPIIRPSILTRNNGKVAVIIFVEFLCVCGYGGLIYTSNIFYQRYEDMSPSQLMVRFLPGRIVGSLTNIVVSLLAAKIAGEFFIILGSCCTVVANLLYAVMDENATYWTYQFFGQALSAVGSEAGNIIASIYIANVVDVTEVAVAGSTLQFAVMFANVCAPSLSTLLYTRLVIAKNGWLLSQEESKGNEQLLTSLKASFWFWAAMGFLAALLTVLFLRSLGKVGKKASEEKSREEVGDTAQRTADSSAGRRDVTDQKKGAAEATLDQGEQKNKKGIVVSS